MKGQSPRPVLEFIIKAAFACLLIGFVVFAVTPSFIREPVTSPANACINNLRQIEGAKQQWALENGITNGETEVSENDIKPYMRLNAKGNLPTCPSGGKYIIGKLDQRARCSLGTTVNPPHILQ